MYIKNASPTTLGIVVVATEDLFDSDYFRVIREAFPINNMRPLHIEELAKVKLQWDIPPIHQNGWNEK